MGPGGIRGALHAAAVVSVMALGAFSPVGAGQVAGAERAHEAWKYPESAALARWLDRVENQAAGADGRAVTLDRLLRRAALDNGGTGLRRAARRPGAGLEFGLGAESPSAARQAPAAAASSPPDPASAQARRAALVEALSRITSRPR